MRNRSDPRLVHRLDIFAATAAAFSAAVGLSGLAGWVLHIESLNTWGAAPVTMKANTAVCFILTGLSLWGLRKKSTGPFGRTRKFAANIAATGPILVGLLALWEMIVNRDFGIDQFLVAAPAAVKTASIRPGLMSPITAAAFVLFGLALLGIDWRTRSGRWPAQSLSLLAGASAMFGVLSFAFDPRIYAAHLSLALPTAVTMVVFSLGLVCSRTQWGLGALLCSQSLGGSLARRLLPAAFIPVMVGWIRWRITASGHYSEWSIVVLASVVTMSLLASIIAWAAVAVDRNDVERRKVEEALNVTEEQLDRLLNRLTEPPDESELRRKVTTGFVIAVLLTSFTSFLTWRSARQASEDSDWVSHTQSVLKTLEVTLRHLLDVETGGRGFALSGNELFLESFQAGRTALASDVEDLGRLINDNPNQERRFERLRALATTKIETSSRLVSARRQTQNIPTLAKLQPGNDVMNEVRITIHQMEAEEELLLDQRSQRTHAARRLATVIMVLGSLLTLGFLLTAGFNLTRQSARARAQVTALNADLERRVEQRTEALRSEIAERNRVKEALLEQSKVLDLAQVLVRDMESRIVLWNLGAEKLYGFSKEEAVGRISHELLQTQFPAPIPVLEEELHGTGSWEGELIHRRRDGSRIVVSSLWVLHSDAQGIPTRILEANVDITARKQAEELLSEQAVELARQAEEAHQSRKLIQALNDDLEQRVLARTAQLETANKELESFSYSVSHDLRAPLRHIGGFSKMLVEEFGATLDPTAQHYLERIQSGTQKMGLLVDELLNLARIGRHSLNVQPTILRSVVEEVIAILQPDTSGRHVEWRIADLPTVECDPVLVKQIFQNLLANALKFTRLRDHAVIEIEYFEKSEDSQAIFMVRDNGIGFNMKYVDKLFGVFQRLHRAEDFEGTGIGLATVQRIVQKHGGKAWAQGELDRGASFSFTLTAENRTELKSRDATAGGRL